MMGKLYGLVITDDVKKSKEYKRVLDEAGYQTYFATTGHRAQISLAFTSPDLIVLDLNLPDMQGGIILRQINAHVRLRHARVVVIAHDELTADSLPGWVDVVLPAPVSPEQLRELAVKLQLVEIRV